MDLGWEDERSSKFVTNVCLITSKNEHGHNISAVEWTHHISYSPGLIAISINKADLTYENIAKSKEFGVNLASVDQRSLVSLSGNYSGRTYDKISALRELGFKFFEAKEISVFMVGEAALNAECKLIQEIPAGDHILLIGKVVHLYPLSDKMPLAYYQHKFWNLGKNLLKPSNEERAKMKEVFEKHKK
ncbi:MAG TPA: flavin reductase family protein [Candidatus Nanoarchaeia archaeon]|nr:flavin reductase family protein [Candidatus Nanoarchaeia archaeon]